jgi:hypothetical protein
MDQVMSIGSAACLLLAAWVFGSSTVGTVAALFRERRNASTQEIGGALGGILYAVVLVSLARLFDPTYRLLTVLVIFGAVSLAAGWCSLMARRGACDAAVAQDDSRRPLEAAPGENQAHRVRNALIVGGLTTLAFALTRCGSEHGTRIAWFLVPLSEISARLPLSLVMGAGFGLLWFRAQKPRK